MKFGKVVSVIVQYWMMKMSDLDSAIKKFLTKDGKPIFTSVLTEEEWNEVRYMDLERCPYLPKDPEYNDWTEKYYLRLKARVRERLDKK